MRGSAILPSLARGQWVPTPDSAASWRAPSRGFFQQVGSRDQTSGNPDPIVALEVEDQLVQIQAGLAAGVEGTGGGVVGVGVGVGVGVPVDVGGGTGALVIATLLLNSELLRLLV